VSQGGKKGAESALKKGGKNHLRFLETPLNGGGTESTELGVVEFREKRKKFREKQEIEDFRGKRTK